MNWCHLALSFVLCFQVTSFSNADDKVATPFNGKDLSGWKIKGDNKDKSKWTVALAKVDQGGKLVVEPASGSGELVNAAGGGVDIFTEAKFGDCVVALEVMVPKGSNSGVYLMGNYELQILDSFGKEKVGPGDLGGIYGAAAPKLNAAKAPGEWQTLEIDFTAPKFTDGKKSANARFNKVVLNGQVIHENIEVKGVTGGSLGQGEQATGPLMFQGDHGAVAFRKIRISTK